MVDKKSGSTAADAKPSPAKRKAMDFSRPMQSHILAAALRVPGMMARLREVLEPDYFDDDKVSDVLAWARNHWDQHHQVPSKAALLDTFADLSKFVKRLYKEEIPDTEHIVERCVNFARNAAMRHAIMVGARIIHAEAAGEEPTGADGKPLRDRKSGKVPDPVELVRTASLVGFGHDEVGMFYSKTMVEREQDFLHPEQEVRVSTGMQHLDTALGGGMGRGELVVFLGAAKKGKSHFLVNVGVGACKQGLKVNHYTLEMKEKKVLRRYDTRIAGMKVNFKEDLPKFLATWKTRSDRLLKANLLVKYWPTRTASVDMLRAHLIRSIAEGHKPDLVIVDYGDIMKPSRRMGEMRHEQAGIFEDLRALAGEYDIVVVTATQARRAAVNKELVTMEDIAESFEKVQIADAVIAICQTLEEKQENKGRLFLAAIRGEQDGVVVEYVNDWSRSIVRTTGINYNVTDRKAKAQPGSEAASVQEEAASFEKAVARRQQPVAGKR